MMRTSRNGMLAAAGMIMLAAVLFITAKLIINTTFMLYDDEGYVLLTYQKFIAGERLYDDIFTQYGPFPYVYHWLLSTILNAPLTHMLGRGLTAFHWTCGALLAGAVALRLTRHWVSGLFAALATFGLLWQINSEPSHPGSLICLVLAAAACGTCTAIDMKRWHWLTMITGSTAALLLLTKINVGALFLAGAGTGALLVSDWPVRWRKPATLIATAALIALPWLLMNTRSGETWVTMLALQFSIAAAGAVWIATASRRPQPADGTPPDAWWLGLAALIATLTAICAVVFFRGTSSDALFRAIVTEPLRFPGRFMIALRWHESTGAVALVCTFVVAIAGWQLRQRGELSRWTRSAVIALRLVAAALFVANIQTWLTIQGCGGFANYCLPLLPLFLIPLHGNRPGHPLIWTTFLVMPQILHIYPVAGSQLGWGTFMFVPLLTAGLYDTWRTLGGHASAFLRWGPCILLLAGATQIALLFQTGWERYSTSKPLGLPGAEDIRVDNFSRMMLRLMTLNAGVHVDLLFSKPGMFSYNLWSGVSTPTSKNATHWFTLLGERDQAAIMDRLGSTPRSAVITSDPLDDFLASVGVATQSPLQRYIKTNYHPLFEISGYHFCVPNGSRAIPFGITEHYVPSNPADAATPPMLQACVALTGRPASLRMSALNNSRRAPEVYLPSRLRITLEPINANGDQLGPPVQLTGAEEFHGLYRLRVYSPPPITPALPQTRVLEILDAQNSVLADTLF